MMDANLDWVAIDQPTWVRGVRSASMKTIAVKTHGDAGCRGPERSCNTAVSR